MTFLMLGGLEVRNGEGRLIPIPRLKQRQLLVALLLKANTPASFEYLTDALWGEEPPASAEQNLKTYVHTLRRLLSPDAPRSAPIETQANTYLVTLGEEDLDLLAFREHIRRGRGTAQDHRAEAAHHHYQRALDLWRGDPFPNARGSRVLNDAAACLGEERLTALEEFSEIRIGLERYAEAVPDLRAAAGANPTRERLWGQLMLALHGAGDRAAALHAYERLAKAVMERTGLEPSPTLRDLHRRIISSTEVTRPVSPSGPERSAGTSVTAGNVPLPRQLPRDPGGFVGRAEELVRLRSLLSPWDGGLPHHVVAITGPPGAGKSALAIRAAHAVRDRFPDGQLYANLHGATPGLRPLEPLEVLGRFLRALGVAPQAVPTDVDEAAALWRSLLDGRNLLVVLDDAVDLPQVRPLLSVPEGNTVLVNSRRTFALVDDCVHVPIGRLRHVEATTMLAKLAGAERTGRDPEATAHLVELCGGLPLAVAVAGARLANRPRWEVADLVERLRDERRRLRELEAGDIAVRSSLGVSYDLLTGSADHLDREAARALRALGVLRVPDVTPHVVGALLDVPAEEAERALERLADGHLVEADGAGRYRLHDLVRLFASEQALHRETRKALDEMLNRALEFYISAVCLAAKILQHPRYPRWTSAGVTVDVTPLPLISPDGAHEWLEHERVALVAAASQAMAAAEERTARLGVALAFAFYWFLYYSGASSDLFLISRQTLETGRRLYDRDIKANAHNYVAIALEMNNRAAEAVPHLQRQLHLCRQLSDPHGEQKALGSLAVIYNYQERHEEVLRCAEEQLRVSKAIGHRSGEHYAMAYIGLAHHRLGRLDQALAVLNDALDKIRKDDEFRSYHEAIVLEKLGEVHVDRGDPASAKACYENALTCVRAAKANIAEPYLLLGLARASRLLGEIDEAADHLARSVAGAQAMGIKDLDRQLAEEQAALREARGAEAAPVRSGVMTP
ncbi:BTAD domain-containing putative transcriptional regulator [Streptosporangium sandarakinum]|uniref:DNA-binding SARP family transcriptional activator n=1 Tax=Streptosporangium sandarakinum TaxID=1260955 RepID=A0A852UNI7_9ACTN|nr:BTAD domain-containing putative transcriptional regulator [Streptosporangium sandarakinum]NYF38947.1 DNA-binding SARP family transcriptional activator [Streptosporangium sandarakinum]